MFKGKPNGAGGGSSGKSLKSLCGYVANEETVTLENGKHLTVGFCVRIYDTITIATHTLLPAIIESFQCLNFFSNICKHNGYISSRAILTFILWT